MKIYMVHFSDADSLDWQTPIAVTEGTSLTQVARIALDEFEAQHGGDLRLPLFLDIHAASDFAAVNWMHGEAHG